MNRNSPTGSRDPMADTRPDHHEPDALDQAFTAFFRTQIPATWPSAPRHTETIAGVANRNHRTTVHRWQPRLTLAASVVALFGLGISLTSNDRPNSSNTTNVASDIDKNKATADGSKLVPPVMLDTTP